jgi:hypothetical protein
MSANSSVAIVNMALLPLGVRPITAMDDGSKAATLANAIFDTERDATLAAHEWNFAITRVALARSATDPAFGWEAQFPLPADSIRVLSVDPDVEYRIEGRAILTNATALSVRYLRRVTSPTEMSDVFKSVLAQRLRWKMAYALTEQVGIVDREARAYEALLGEARTLDAQEGSVEDVTGGTPNAASVLLDVRAQGMDSWWGVTP